MRDISRKVSSLRTATAVARLMAAPATIQCIHDRQVPKGDPLEVAKVAAVQAAKNTPQIIPYCHPLPVEFVGVEYQMGEDWIEARVMVKAVYKTGVEVEAMTAASVCALTLYDMLKMIDGTLSIGEVKLLSKHGGKSDFGIGLAFTPRVAVVVSSDSVAAGQREDRSGRKIVLRLKEHGVEEVDYRVLPDDAAALEAALVELCDKAGADLILTTGGTGLGPRDVMPEVMSRVIEKEAPGLAEAARVYGQQRTPLAMFSRGRAGVRGRTLLVNLPGSLKGVSESMDMLWPALLHALEMIRGGGHTG